MSKQMSTLKTKNKKKVVVKVGMVGDSQIGQTHRETHTLSLTATNQAAQQAASGAFIHSVHTHPLIHSSLVALPLACTFCCPVSTLHAGKTSLMVKYVEGQFNEDYIQTLGVNFMEKTIALRNTEITFSIWDLGGQQEYLHMLPLVCNDAVALLFMFDLSRKSTLTSVKNWYKQARLLNKVSTSATHPLTLSSLSLFQRSSAVTVSSR